MIADLFLRARVPLAMLLLGFAIGWQINEWQWCAKKAAELQAVIDTRIAAEQSAAEHSAKLEAQIANVQKSIRRLTRRHAHKKRSDTCRCPLAPSGVQLLNSGRTGE